jgi:glutamate/aspartate transport system substrate-binding protein
MLTQARPAAAAGRNVRRVRRGRGAWMLALKSAILPGDSPREGFGEDPRLLDSNFRKEALMHPLVPAGLALAATLAALPAWAAELGGTLKKIQETGMIVIGHRESSIPFSYLDDKQQPVGYAMDLCMKVVDRVKADLKMPNLQVKLNPVTSQTRIPLLTNGTVDMECGSTTNSMERQKQVAFSVAYFITKVRMVTKANAGVNSLADLNGQPVVTTTGTTSDRLIKENEVGSKIDVKNIYGKDHAESFLMMKTDRAKAFVMDDVLLAGLIANDPNPKDYVIAGETLRVEPYAIMFRKDDPQFKKIVDETLVGLMKSGEAEKIYAKWFVNAIPPKGINLNLPPSPELKDAFKNPTDAGV